MSFPYIWENEVIKVRSSLSPVTCQQKVYPDIQDDGVLTDREEYSRYRPTPLQFEINSNVSEQTIEITFSYANRLTETEIKYTQVCQHYGENQWIPLTATMDTGNKTIIAQTDRTGVIGIFINEYWYSMYTQRLADEFPIWTKIRQDRKSVGQQFLNFFGMELEKIEDSIIEVQKQKYINELNEHTLDWIYLYELPPVNSQDEIHLYQDGKEIPIFDHIKSLFYNKNIDGGIIDYEERRFYSTQYYDRFSGVVVRPNDRASFTADPIPHHIWNAFDEFGLLVGVKRLFLESNKDYRERILDVFRYPANSSRQGLIHGIGRELNLIKRIEWKDDTKNLYLKGKGIIPDTIRIDGQEVQPNMYYVDPYGHVVIYSLNQGVKHVVSFVKGIDMYELHDYANNEALHKLMFYPDGQATPRLKKWVDYINQVAPVMWNHFNWDEGFWDTIDSSLTGVGYLPNIWDSDTSAWESYTFDSKRWESASIWR